MTEQEKAIELVEKANKILGYYHYHSCEETKDVALMCVDNTIEALELHSWQNMEIILFYKKIRTHIIEME